MDANIPMGIGESPQANLNSDKLRSDWLLQHATVVMINPTTGNVYR